MRRSLLRGFTLVELLVVITIIGILVGMLMPAVNAAREAGRRATCQNNLKNLGQASLQHLEKQGYFPTGGWGDQWVGDPDRGFTKNQPGGWIYNLMPYLEGGNIHDLGMGEADAQKREKLKTASMVAPSIIICPTRRRVAAFPFKKPTPIVNANAATEVGKSDYAICGGDLAIHRIAGPTSLQQGDQTGTSSYWETTGKDAATKSTGVSFLRSQIESAHVTDGMGFTYLAGEKYLRTENYTDGSSPYDDQAWNSGFDWDLTRWTAAPPQRDRMGYDAGEAFGGPHATGWNAVFCGGNVRAMRYDIDANVHRWLGSRADRNPIDESKIQ